MELKRAVYFSNFQKKEVEIGRKTRFLECTFNNRKKATIEKTF